MNYTFEDYMNACDKAHGAVDYLCRHFREYLNRDASATEAKSLIEARHLLIKAQKAALDEALRIMLTRPKGSKKE